MFLLLIFWFVYVDATDWCFVCFCWLRFSLAVNDNSPT